MRQRLSTLSGALIVSSIIALFVGSGCGPNNESDDQEVVFIDTGTEASQDTGIRGSEDVSADAAVDDEDTMHVGDTGTPDTSTPNDTGIDTGMARDTYQDPCGNGVVDQGETCDGDCPTSCDDDNPCTKDNLSGDPEACTAECTHTPEPACSNYDGSYSGSYYVLAEEKVGSSVINSVECSGTFDADVDTGSDEHIDGSAECTYSGGLSGYDGRQTATIEGMVEPDGSVSLDIVHDFGTENDGDFSVEGSIASGSMTVDDTESFLPNSYSSVAWDVKVKLGSN